MKNTAYHIATVFGLGDRLPAPGTTAGSLPAALIWVATAWAIGGSPWLFTLTTALTILAIIAGIWAADAEILRRKAGDPGPVVVDEVAGQWLTYSCALPMWAMSDFSELLTFAAGGFFLFRLFDVVKPWPVNRLERLPGGFGVMADDLAAGLLAGLLLALGRPWLGWAVELVGRFV